MIFVTTSLSHKARKTPRFILSLSM
jgi:hypothetical protein